jgi:monofunctional chorismate mutase
MKDLQELRTEIDEIDRQLVALFEKRMNTVIQVAEYKRANNIPVLNATREQQVIDKCVSLLENKSYTQAVTEWMKTTMSLSRTAETQFLDQNQSTIK